MSALVSDTVLAGGPDDFLTVRHLVLRGGDEAIGHALAVVARDELGVDKRPGYSDPEASIAQRRWLADQWPQHDARRRGAAAAFGATPDDPTRDFGFLQYDWAVPGCSNCFWPGSTTRDGHAVLSRNYDFTTGTVFELMGRPAPAGARPATSRPFVVETHPEAGHSTLTITDYELLGGALDGMNSAGLGVALMATVEALRGGGPPPTGRNQVGLSELQVIRFLLERAGSATEARALLARAPQYAMWVPCHFLVADAHGDSFLWSHEIGPTPVCVDGVEGAPFCATNRIPGHALADIPQREESVERLTRLRAAVAAAGAEGPVDRADIRAANQRVAATTPVGEGQYRGASPARTLWHAVYDLSARRLAVDFYLGEGSGEGEVRRSPYLELGLGSTR